jgi:co-chaperonin GroES (HSP10)
MNPTNLKPCGPNVLIRRKKTEAATASGIVLPGKERETTIYCEVLAVGEEVKRAQPGDTIVVVPMAGLDLDEDDMCVIAEKDVLAVVTEAA